MRLAEAIGIAAAVIPRAAFAQDANTPVDEVTVRGTRNEEGETSLTRGDVRNVPGAFGDAFRTIEALPGSTPMISGIPYVFIRGAPPGNSGYFIDGVRVPLLYHVGQGPGIIPPSLISRLDYYPSGYPARFGGFVGGIVSADTTAPSDRARGEAVVRAFDAGALVESPFAGGRGDALVAGRYSFTAAALSLFSPGVSLGYWDYQARAGWALGDHEHVGVFAFGSHDFRGELPGLNSQFASDFHRVDLRYDRVFAADDRLRVALTLGADRSGNEQGSASGRMAAARVEVERRIAPPLRARFGSSVTLTHYDAGVPAHGPSDITLTAEYPEHEDLIAGAYADVIWRPNPKLEIVPGLRADLYTWRRLSPVIIYDAYGNLLPAPPPKRAVPALDPRLAARFTVHPRVAVFAQIAQAHQGPSFYVPVPGVEPSSFPSGLQSALQTSAGVEVALPAEITATATGFRNTFDNVNDFGTCTLYEGEIDVRSGCLDERRSGQAYGLEVFVRRPLTRAVGGWISYTLSRTEDEFPSFDFGKQASNTRSIPTPFDRTHVVNVVASCDLGRGWRAGARLLAYSGAPYYIYDYLGVYRSANLVPPTAIPSNLAIDRFPWFYRVDLRLEKRWPLGRTGYLAVVAEGLNVTLQREPINVSCGADGTACSPVMGSPFAIPSVGVEGAL